MSVVWLATDERLGRPVAIKVLSDVLTSDSAYLERFRREAKVAAGLQHPNLVSVYDFHSGATPVSGDGVRRGRATWPAACSAAHAPTAERLARELLAALRHIHAAGVLHRDIKPQNVLIDAHGHARLTDFGIAQPRDAASLTRTGQVIGTEAYIAPEVKAGEPASERSDLYALGVLLADIAREGAGAPLWALIDRLREQAPEARPASAGDALAELESAAPPPLSGETTQPFHVTEEAEEPTTAIAGPREPFEPTGLGRRSGTRRPWLRIGVLVAALLLVTAAAIVIASSGDEGAKTGGTHNAAKADGGSAKRSGDGGSGSGGGSSSAEVSTTARRDDDAGGARGADPDHGRHRGRWRRRDRRRPRSTTRALASSTRVATRRRSRCCRRRWTRCGPPATSRPTTTRSTTSAAPMSAPGATTRRSRCLQERMQYDDGQLDTVQGTLDEALAGAGQAPTGGTSEPKPGNPAPPGQTGAVPPGHQDEGEGDSAAAEPRRALLGEGDHALDEVAGLPLLALRLGLGVELLASSE